MSNMLINCKVTKYKVFLAYLYGSEVISFDKSFQ